MSVTINIPVGIPMPLVSSVEAIDRRSIKITWGQTLRPSQQEIIDLSPLVDCFKVYRKLRDDEDLFRSVHVIDDGNAIAWGDDSIDMSATAIESLADEAMSADEFQEFIIRNALTHAGAAVVLGYSRRQIENFLGGEKIPRVVSLACYGFEAKSLRAKLGWSARARKSSEFGTVIQSTTTESNAIVYQPIATAA